MYALAAAIAVLVALVWWQGFRHEQERSQMLIRFEAERRQLLNRIQAPAAAPYMDLEAERQHVHFDDDEDFAAALEEVEG